MISMPGSRDPTAQAKDEPADANSPHHLPNDDSHKAAAGVDKRKRSRTDRHDREAIKDERGRVIGQPLALENDDQAPRKLHALRDRQGRHRVGRRNDGAQDEADRPGKAQQEMGRRGDGDGREHDTADRQERDRAQVEAEFLPAHLHRVPIDDRRQHEQQDKIGSELQARQPRDQGEPNAGDHKENGRGNLQSFRDEADHGYDGQKQDQNLERFGHFPVGSPRRVPHQERHWARSLSIRERPLEPLPALTFEFQAGLRPGLKKQPAKRNASADLGAPITQVRDLWPISSTPLADLAIRRRFPR